LTRLEALLSELLPRQKSNAQDGTERDSSSQVQHLLC
jgi:hypothetical protein